jgi:hypothetical protein
VPEVLQKTTNEMFAEKLFLRAATQKGSTLHHDGGPLRPAFTAFS